MAGKIEPVAPEDALLLVLDSLRTELLAQFKPLHDAVNRTPDPALQGTLNTIVRRLDTPQESSVQVALEDIAHTLTQIKPMPRWAWSLWPASVGLVGLLGVALGWQTGGCAPAVQVQAGLMGQVDAVLVERYSTLPSALQSTLTQLYTKAGLQPPGQRKGRP